MTVRESHATKVRILDAAERLFSEHGFDGTSMRAITSEADVNLAAVHYHFGSKEALLTEVLGRRLRPLNRRRIEALARAREQAGDRPPAAGSIVRALIRPAFEFLRELGEVGDRFVRLAGRAHNDPSPNVRAAFRTHFEDLAREFHAALCDALPDLPPQEVSWRMHFFVGSMAHVLAWTRHDSCVPALAEDLRHGETGSVEESLVAFCAAGMTAPLPAPPVPS